MEPNPKNLSARKWLADQGLHRGFMKGTRFAVVSYVAVIIATPMVLYFVGLDRAARHELTAVVLAFITVAMGYREWLLSRYESSMDKFYSRLDTSNQALRTLPSARALIFETTPLGRFDLIMYTYGELDTLDYVVQKYSNGLMDADQAYRGVMTFYARLINSPFRMYTSFCLTNPGYSRKVRDLVKRLSDLVDEEQETTVKFCPHFNAFCLRHPEFCTSAQSITEVMSKM